MVLGRMSNVYNAIFGVISKKEIFSIADYDFMVPFLPPPRETGKEWMP